MSLEQHEAWPYLVATDVLRLQFQGVFHNCQAGESQAGDSQQREANDSCWRTCWWMPKQARPRFGAQHGCKVWIGPLT